MERSAWAWMPVAALLLSSVHAPPCAAQPPVPPSTMPPGVNPLARQGGEQPHLAAADGVTGSVLAWARAARVAAGLAHAASNSGARRSGTAGMAYLSPRNRLEPEARAAGADRPPLPDQPRHRPAALRRPAADRGRRPGQRLGGRGGAHTGQAPLGPDAQHRLRLYPPRRRRPGLQQGHHDRARA